MSARIIAANLPKLAEPSPIAEHLHGVIRRLLRRFISRAGTGERALAVEDRVAMGPKKSLVLVRCHGQRFLIATAGDTIGPIIEVNTPKPAGRRASGSNSRSISMERKA